jgi:hypothetical protein
MSASTSPSLDQILVNEDHDFVTLITPRQGQHSMPELTALFQAHRPFFMDKVAKRGVVLFRGFPPSNTADFDTLIDEGLRLKPWNGFNLKGMPAFVTNWLRAYTEGLMGSGDYRRYLGRNTVQLGPVGASVQGPHVEGGGSPTRARYLALCCFEPASHLAETGVVDLHAAFERMPAALQAKYRQAYNRFYFITARKLTWLDKLILGQSPMKIFSTLADGRRVRPPRNRRCVPAALGLCTQHQHPCARCCARRFHWPWPDWPLRERRRHQLHLGPVRRNRPRHGLDRRRTTRLL